MKEKENNNKLERRTILKSLVGLPVLGFLGYEAAQKKKFIKANSGNSVMGKLGLQDLKSNIKSITPGSKGDLLRIGLIGYGNRGKQLAKSLGFLHPETYAKRKKENTLDDWSQRGDLNIAITGICDVFDLHAEKGVLTAGNDIRTGGEFAQKHPPKRYKHWHDLINDKEIDAVIIATPTHHHVEMTVEAIKAGKHVYCEKNMIRSEEEIYRIYDTVKNSDRVFQLGHQITQNAIFQQGKEIVNRGVLGKISHIETFTNRNTAAGAWVRHLDNNGKIKPGNEKTIDWKQWLGSRPDVPFDIERYYNWTRHFDYDMGMIGQLFTHEYDAVNQLLNIGIPESVMASGGMYHWKQYDGNIPDIVNVIFEYPHKELTLTYSGNLRSSKNRERTFYGDQASMTLGGSLAVTVDRNSSKYKEQLKSQLVSPTSPMISIFPGAMGGDGVDAVTGATAKYYASRGLTTTKINGNVWDVTYLHLKEWIDCIRNGGTPSANIDRAFDEAVTITMAHISYREKCRVKWDAVNRQIIRC